MEEKDEYSPFIVALFGTYQIAANGVAQSIWSMAALAGVSMGPAFITVIEQCMGNGDVESADYYFRKLTKITLLLSTVWNALIFLLTLVIMQFYALSPETKRLVIWLVLCVHDFRAAAFIISFGKYIPYGSNRYCYCNGLRLDYPRSHIHRTAKVRKVEIVSGDLK